MGTSSNSAGSSSRSPLVPPHADAEPGSPVPQRPEKGLSNFRRSLTGYIKSGDPKLRNRSLARYAKGAAGGSATGARRFGAVSVAGAAALGALADLAQGGTGEQSTGEDLSAAIGAPVEVAAEIIAQAVAPDNSEGETVRILIEEAICEVLQGEETLEVDLITPEFLDDVLFEYIVDAIIHDILVREGSPSLDAASSPEELRAREIDLKEVVKSEVDNRLAAHKSDRSIAEMSQAEREQLQIDTVRSVLEVWEDYEE